jgi:hypothetical protein
VPSPAGQRLLPTLILGASGLLVLGIQPLLYVAYIHQGLVSEARIGTLAAAEIIAIAIGSMAGIRLLASHAARRVGLLGLAVLVAGNLLPEAVPLFAARALAGIGGGIVVALAAAQIALRANVNAASGLFLFLQAASQYAILQGVSLLAPQATAMELQVTLASLAVAAAPLLLLIPRELDAQEDPLPSGVPGAAGLIGLAVAGLFVGAAIAVWAYLGLWLQSVGIAEAETAAMLTVALLGQMVGALAATGLGMRWQSSWQVAASGAAMIAIVLLLLAGNPAGPTGWALLAGFGFVWMVGTPALSGLLLEYDPQRRALPYGASAQLLGAALIPTVTGEALATRGIAHILIAAMAIMAAAVLLIGVRLAATRRALIAH